MRHRNGRFGRNRRIEIPPPAVLDRQSGQRPRPIGPGVDPDAVRPLIHSRTNGVTMNDDETVIAVAEKEWFSDPPQIRLQLTIKTNARTNASVDEQVIAKAAGIDKAAEKLDVRGRYCLANNRERGLVAKPGEALRIDAIALQAFFAAEPAPFGNQLSFAAKNPKEHFLVIAENEDRPHPGVTIGPQPLNHLTRVRPAIDKVAEKYEQHFVQGTGFEITMDVRQELFEKIEPAVDVAHDVRAPAPGAARLPASWVRSSEHGVLNSGEREVFRARRDKRQLRRFGYSDLRPTDATPSPFRLARS